VGEETPKPASAPTGAVFLSYASQDAEAAQKICDALRAAGIEVWFDQSELRGGDAWDQSIRRQIKSCALFLPIISQHTHERAEGYFRLEWKLAVDRSHLIMANKAFLVPVVIDQTADDDENVPDRFREVQWTRLPAGETPPPFVSRIAGLVDSQTSSTGAGKSTPPLANPVIPRRTVPRRASVLPLLAVLVVASVGVWVFWSRTNVPSTPAPPAAEEKSLAVLPFVDMSERHDQEYFSDGLSEELIDRLAHSPDLKVIARTSSFAFKGKNDDVRTIAARLGVANLLEGSVRKSDNMLRITAQLIRARDGAHIWSESFDRNVANIFQIQEEIAATVAAALQTALSAPRTSANADVRPDAYNALLRGKYFRRRNGKGDLDRSVTAYQDAIRLQPNYALAWSGLASTFNKMGVHRQLTPPEAYRRARESLNRALEISPDLADAHYVLGTLLWNYQFDFRQALTEFSRALELDPRVDLGNHQVIVPFASGRSAEAVHEARRLVERDPLSEASYSELSWTLYHDSQFDEAEATARKALELNPLAEGDYAKLADIALARNEPAKALELLVQEPDEPSKESGTIEALWMLDRRDEANRLLRAFEKQYGDSYAFSIASIYVLRGDLDAAFRWLDRAHQNREPYLTLIRGHRDFRGLHDDPRYKALLRKMNLPE
jgi:TolB-like protein/Tfp pilus assembly protein PilF